LKTVTREAKIDDLDRLYVIELECFDHEAITKTQLAYFLRSPRFVSLVVEVNSDIAGFIIGSVEYHENKVYGHVYSLDVSRRYRRMGVASKLLDEAEKIFAKNEAEVCFLEVRTDNVEALRLYKKQGYIITGTLKNYYSPGLNGFRFKKELAPQ